MKGQALLREGYILMEHEHVSDAEAVFARIEAVAKLAWTSGFRRLFVDTAFMHSIWRPDEVPDIIGLTQEMFPPGVVIATIPPAQDSLAMVQEIVRQLNAAGFPCRMFDTKREALDWLMAQPAPEAEPAPAPETERYAGG